MSRAGMGGRLIPATALGCAVVVLAGLPAMATPTGLNNIPTADVVPTDILVLQGFANFDGDTSWFAGLKVGAAENCEIGLDGQVGGPGSGGGPTFQAKYKIPLHKGARLALGAANISGDAERHGDGFPYVVASVPLGERANGHLGYSFQSDNHALSFGADATVGKSVTLRTDWIQTDDGDESMWSLGLIAPLAKGFLVEGWASFPSAAEAETNYVLKVDYVVPLGG